MSSRNWGLIGSGAQFEGLTRTIVHFEDPDSTLFGRPGKDGGQDARSGDGSVVYQAKFIGSQSAAEAFTAAAVEADKIGRYRTLGHERFKQWENITTWRLVTNALFNPTDHERQWQDQIVPLFQRLELKALYWSQTELDGFITKYPEIERAYFSGKTRLFLSLPEARVDLAARDQFLDRDKLVDFVGRSDELARIDAFASSQEKYLILHGPGGVGKSRLMLEGAAEAARRIPHQILWANTASLQCSDEWFLAIIPERSTLLLLDEPSDPDFLRVLLEQLRGRASRWKLLIAVRSAKDPILSRLRAEFPQKLRQELEVKPLRPSDSEAHALALIDSGPLGLRDAEYRQEAARLIATSYQGYPIWQALAVHLLERDGRLSNLPAESGELAQQYVGELVQTRGEWPEKAVLAALRWLSVLGTVDRGDSRLLALLSEKCGLVDAHHASELLDRLVERRALHQRGAYNRLVEVKPDVIRDHLLLKWLVRRVEHGQTPVIASAEGKRLVADLANKLISGQMDFAAHRLVGALGKAEVLQWRTGFQVDLLSDIFVVVRKSPEIADEHTLQVLTRVAALRPMEAIAICRRARGRESQANRSFLKQLAEMLGAAATGITADFDQLALFAELHEVAKQEWALFLSPGDRTRSHAAEAFRLVLTGERGYWANYLTSVENFVFNLLEARTEAGPTEFDGLLEIFLQAVLSSEREHHQWDNRRFTLTTVYVLPNHPFWPHRVAILAKLRRLLESRAIDNPLRLRLWKALTTAHASLLRNVGEDDTESTRDYLLSELAWANEKIPWDDLGFEELAVARPLWDWHLEFDKCGEVRRLAERLEAHYLRQPLVEEFRGAFGRLARSTDRVEAWKAIALRTGELTDTSELDSFFTRATEYLRAKGLGAERLALVARLIGQKAVVNNTIASYVEDGLVRAHGEYNHFIDLAGGWMAAARQNSPDEGLTLATKLVEISATPELRAALVLEAYGYCASMTPSVGGAEVEWLRLQARHFREADKTPDFARILAQTFETKPIDARRVFDASVEGLSQVERLAAIGGLLEGLDDLTDRPIDPLVLQMIKEWLLELILPLADIGDLPGMAFHHLKETMDCCGGLTISEFTKLLRQRAERPDGETELRFRGNGIGDRFSQLVTPLRDGDRGNADAVTACGELLELLIEMRLFSMEVRPIILDIDPLGVIVPEVVGRKVASQTGIDAMADLAQFVGCYRVGSDAWKEGAIPTLTRSASLDERGRVIVYQSISENSFSLVGHLGEVPPVYTSMVDSTETELRKETEPTIRAFWRWRLDNAKDRVAKAAEEAREERGE